MQKSLFFIVGVFLWSGILASSDVESLAARVERSRLQEHLEVLGSDRLEGRGTGTEGGRRAADYIAGQLSAFGVTPMGLDGSFFQEIPLRGSLPQPSSRLTLVGEDWTRELDLASDYLLFRTGAQTFVPTPVPLVFGGYGIIAPEYDYNSYQDVEIAGKIVVLLTGEPFSEEGDPFFSGPDRTIYSSPAAKHRLAISRGARGTLLIPNPRDLVSKAWSDYREDFAFEHVTLAYSPVGSLSLLINPEVAPHLFRGSRRSLGDVFAGAMSNELKSFDLKVRVQFDGVFRQREFIGRNVVGLIPGDDPRRRDAYLLISAHYDGLGIGPAIEGDRIYNSVFDNASGVGALLEIARILAQEDVNTARSIILLFTAAEEKGLLGAYYYTENPVVPLSRTMAAVNIDGLAFFDTFSELLGIGGDLSSLGSILEEYASDWNLEVRFRSSLIESMEAFERSDQVAFAEAGIPSILLLEGFKHRRITREEYLARVGDWSSQRYHSPFDDLNQPMDWNAALQHTGVILGFVRHLANQEEAPKWEAGAPYIHARLQSLAEGR